MNNELKEFSNEIRSICDGDDFITFLSLNHAYGFEVDCYGLRANFNFDTNTNVKIQYDPDCHCLTAEISEIQNALDSTQEPRTWSFDSDKDIKFNLN